MSEDTSRLSSGSVHQSDVELVNKPRRRFAKVGVVAPVIMTLTSKVALGGTYQCTISGVQSGNTSNHSADMLQCGVGFSPGGWWSNADKTDGSPDGCLAQWLQACVNPFTLKTVKVDTKTDVETESYTISVRKKTLTKYKQTTTVTTTTTTSVAGVSSAPVEGTPVTTVVDDLGSGSVGTTTNTTTVTKKYIIQNGEDVENAAVYDVIATSKDCSGVTRGTGALATTFSSIFGVAPPGLNSNASMHEVLYYHQSGGGTLDFHAVADYLNAAFYAKTGYAAFASVYADLSPGDIVGLYQIAIGNLTSFTSSSGAIVTSSFNGGVNGSGVKSFLVSIHH